MDKEIPQGNGNNEMHSIHKRPFSEKLEKFSERSSQAGRKGGMTRGKIEPADPEHLTGIFEEESASFDELEQGDRQHDQM